MYVAIIGDIIKSREIVERNSSQLVLNHILAQVNHLFREDIHSDFLITLGDEFQGLLKNPHNALKIVEFIQLNFYPHQVRIGIGIGDIETSFIRNEALGADGPVYHKARKMIDQLKAMEKSRKKCNTRIKLEWGIDSDIETLINSSLNSCSFIQQQWTYKQFEVIKDILMGKTIQDISDEFQIVPTSIYRRLNTSGFYDYVNIRDSVTTVLDNKWREYNE